VVSKLRTCPKMLIWKEERERERERKCVCESRGWGEEVGRVW
jgi:hypothetical protein